MKLFTVGPVACYPVVLKAMGEQMYSHRSAEYKKLHYDTVARLQSYIETQNPIYLFSATGTGFMEAAVRNCVRENLVVCVNGDFGKRFADVAKANGRKATIVEPPMGEPVTPGMLDDALRGHPEIEALRQGAEEYSRPKDI
jgi:aspartate aminotransferase-like enzyme